MINTSTVAHQGRWGVHSITVPERARISCSPMQYSRTAQSRDSLTALFIGEIQERKRMTERAKA
jgi:hypothetical protein